MKRRKYYIYEQQSKSMEDVVTRHEGIKGGRPILRGTKLSVLQVATLVRDDELTPEDIVGMYTGVSDVEMVHGAIEYYDNHRGDMEELKRSRQEAIEQVKERAINQEP